MKKYNEFHGSITDNWRHYAKEAGVDTGAYTDKEIYYVSSYWYGVENENGEDVQKESAIADFKAGVKRNPSWDL